jgi:DNA-directed RNA polymerase subunit RPC12/RpoP
VSGGPGKSAVNPLLLAQEDDKSGQPFMIEDQFRIEDHFREITDPQEKIAFHCPCGFKLHARPTMVDKRGKCPQCSARLLLVGKKNPRSQLLEIHPLVVDEAPSGDTQLFEG